MIYLDGVGDFINPAHIVKAVKRQDGGYFLTLTSVEAIGVGPSNAWVGESEGYVIPKEYAASFHAAMLNEADVIVKASEFNA